jgi:glycerol-3-phosphate dehydrogenase
MGGGQQPVAVIGGGVVGCSVAHALARRGVQAVVLEAEPGLALGASGANSGILHTGFDSTPGELETQLILRSATLRGELLGELGVTVWRCGARLQPADREEQGAVAGLAQNARANGVEAHLQADGSLTVPGEAVTDPAAFVHALAGAAQAGGAEVRLGARVSGLHGHPDGGLQIELHSGERLGVRAAVNCAGLFADELAHMANDDLLAVYPRKGEFLVFRPPAGGGLEQILLPVPSKLGKGVLVFPTTDHQIIAGPTAREREDKRDWSVEADAAELILPPARRMYPPLEEATPIGAYAGLRPAGRGSNYVIRMSGSLPELLHVAAIRSTGLSASLGIGEYVVSLLAQERLIELDPPRPLPAPPARPPAHPLRWWPRREGPSR